jgi:hypothetical protein
MMFLATLPRWLKWTAVALVTVVLVGVLILSLREQERADDSRNQEIGAGEQREANQAATIRNVEKANEARDEIGKAGTAGDAVRFEQCLRTARTPASCSRFNVPVGSTDKR